MSKKSKTYGIIRGETHTDEQTSTRTHFCVTNAVGKSVAGDDEDEKKEDPSNDDEDASFLLFLVLRSRSCTRVMGELINFIQI